ncbi:MAG: family 78 glycoside hydrolase catalytic domain, partial [bacterium]
MQWKAKWIWNDSEEHPRNYWLAFRKTFRAPKDFDDAKLYITADSRYFLYLNGEFIGFGPVRSWPFELFYDTYSIKHLLKPGENTIAVLVTHYGISTFQYIEGRGGLFAQLDFLKNGEIKESIVSDNSWKTKEHTGFQRASVRISCQQAWAEIYDANKFDYRWTEPTYDDNDWEKAIEIGPYGTSPWTSLIPRDIPFLTNEPIYPKRVISLREVRPVKSHISLDLRPNFYPGEYDANIKQHIGYVATLINSPRKMKGRIIVPFGIMGRMKINGEEYNFLGSNEVEVELNEGENLFLMDVSGTYHDPFLNLAFDFPEEISFKSPIGEGEFISIGPFAQRTILQIGYPQESTLQPHPDYERIWELGDAESLSRFQEWIKPILKEHTCKEVVFTLCTQKSVLKEYDVRPEHQNLVYANDSYTEIEPKEGDVELIIDFGMELSGFLEFEVEAGQGTVLDFYAFESLHDGFIEDTTGLHNTLRYVCREGYQMYRSFVRRGFRYVMLTLRNLRKPVRIYSLKTYLTTYPVAEIGTFRSSDYMLNRIWEISKHTERLCMEDTYVDCPAYEQTFWVGDSRNEALINYTTFAGYPLSKRCLKLVPKSLYRSPLPESQVPSGWQNVLTAWSILWMLACKEYYHFTGEWEFLEEIYPYLLQTAKNFKKFINDKGLLDIYAWNMLDWAPMDTPGSGVVTHQNALLVKALKETAEIARILGRSEDEKFLLEFGENLKKAINEHLWDEERKAYIDSIHKDGTRSSVLSLQTQVIIYLSDCATGERKRIIEEYLLEPPLDFVKIGSPFMSFFYFEALAKMGKIERILEEIRNNWGLMLDYDATTCWETFPGSLDVLGKKLTRSHCHAWSAAPAFFLPVYILGVKPVEPGFSKVLIEPNLCDLTWARGTVPTPMGVIEVSYKLRE